MISINLKFSEFIDAVKDKDKYIILSLVESEAKEAEKISEMMECGQDYVNALMGLVYLLRYSQKPEGIKEKHCKLYRVVCERLVEKKQLSSDILEMLDPREKFTRCIGKI